MVTIDGDSRRAVPATWEQPSGPVSQNRLGGRNGITGNRLSEAPNGVPLSHSGQVQRVWPLKSPGARTSRHLDLGSSLHLTHLVLALHL